MKEPLSIEKRLSLRRTQRDGDYLIAFDALDEKLGEIRMCATVTIWDGEAIDARVCVATDEGMDGALEDMRGNKWRDASNVHAMAYAGVFEEHEELPPEGPAAMERG